jgi:4-amino-4-deoxy-L-arabinose transferase-like glycosyltransferase
VLEAAAILLMADFLFRRFPVASWRLGAALAVVVAAGLNQVVVEYGTLGQAYGMCLFATAAAFRCAIAAVDGRRGWMALGAGFFAGVAAASSLLSLAAAPVLLVWIFFRSREGNRWWKAAAVALGAIIPFAPTLWLFSKGPAQVWFNLVQYHVFFRKLYWSDTTRHDLEVVTQWIDCGQALTLGLLALGGVAFLVKRSGWPRALRSELYLCGWLSLGLMAELAAAHPTFPRYFLLAVPFLAPLGAVGVYAAASRMLDSGRPLWPVLLLAMVTAAGLARSLYDRRDMRTWPEYEAMARKVLQVTPKGGSIWADEQMYFAARKRPSPGLEFGYSHKVNLPAAKMALLHIVSEDEVNRRVKSRVFPTVFTCDDDDISDLGLNSLYSHKAEMDDCTIFWGPPPPAGATAVAEPKAVLPDTRKK